VHSKPNIWHEYIHCAVFAYNNAVSSTTGFTPHELLFGYRVQLPSKIITNNSPVYNYDNYKEELRATLKNFWESATNNIEHRKIKNKTYRDTTSRPLNAQIGDIVFLEKPYKEHKFAAPYKGPYTIEEFLTPLTARIFAVWLYVGGVKSRQNASSEQTA
jgi:hypothetical protein